MKIDKINENQYKLTLTVEDFKKYDITLEDMFTQNDKIKNVFRDIVKLLVEENGVRFDDRTIIVEAMPLSKDSLGIIITLAENRNGGGRENVQNGRFVDYFTALADKMRQNKENVTLDTGIEQPSNSDMLPFSAPGMPSSESGDAAGSMWSAGVGHDVFDCSDYVRIYEFDELSDIADAAKFHREHRFLNTEVYKSSANGRYYLIITIAEDVSEGGADQEKTAASEFVGLASEMAEMGRDIKIIEGQDSYIREHYELILGNDALKTLKEL